MRARHTGFTLIELLLAGVIAALLIGGMTLMLGGLGRDRVRVQSRLDVGRSDDMLELIHWDLANASTMSGQPNVLTIEGYGGIDRGSMVGTNRAARVTYRVRRDGVRSALVREQRFLDDPIHAEPWTEVVANGATRLLVSSNAAPEAEAAAEPAETTDAGVSEPPTVGTTGPSAQRPPVPTVARVRIEITDRVIDQELRIR